MPIANIANKTCRDEHTYTTKQLKSAKSTTQALQNQTLIILWEGEGGPLQEILISIDSKLKGCIYDLYLLKTRGSCVVKDVHTIFGS